MKCVWPCGCGLPGTKVLFKFFRIAMPSVTNQTVSKIEIDDPGSLVGCNTDG